MKNILRFSLFTFTFSLAFCAAAGGAKRIDFEHHFVSTNHLNYVATRTTPPMYDPATGVYSFGAVPAKWFLSEPAFSANTLYEDLTDLDEKRIAEMDRAGVDVAVISSSMQVDDLPSEAALRIAQASNDDLCQATKRHPDRFMGAALLPALQAEAACAELERCVKVLGFKYWHTYSTIPGPDKKGHHIWEPEFEPILAKAAELGVCIYIHPEYPLDADYWDSGIAFEGAGMGYGQDVMQTAVHLVMNGTFDKYPTLRIILGHMGEYLPYVLDRMNFHMNTWSKAGRGMDTGNVKCEKTLYHYVVTNANIVITTSGAADTNALQCAKEALGADRICFASDWPYESYAEMVGNIDKCDLTDAERDGVWSLNARKYILNDGPGEVITQPWLQNVYTNRFTVMCETKGVMAGLVLQFAEGYAQSVAMSVMDGVKDGTFVCKAEVLLDGAAGATVPYRLVTNNVAIVGTEGSVKLWKDEDADFTCAVWGDNQEGVQKYDWGSGDTGMRYQCITNMFAHMAKAKPDFGFTTGDVSSYADYDDEIAPGELRGADDLFGRTIPYHLVWGNHDCSTTLAAIYTDAAQRYFAPAASEEDGWFYLYRNDVLFIGVHWLWERGAEDAKYKKAEKGIAELLATERAKKAKFRIILQHTPLYLETFSPLAASYWFVDSRLVDVAKAGGVDLVFSGHTHAYERIERDGIVQVVNGGMGYLDHGERWYNNYGSDTKVGGHQNTPLLWARQLPTTNGQRPTIAPAEPVRMGCFQGYGMLSVAGNTLTYKAHAFNADGSYIGVADAFTLESKTAGTTGTSGTTGTKTFAPVVPLADPVNNRNWLAFKASQGEAWEIPAGASETDPVVNVSKTEIERFCAALNADGKHNYRLPTVAELTAIFGGNLKRDVSEWTADVDPNSGWCRILGGNKVAVDYTWCREFDKPAMASSDCHANYLGFRVVDEATPIVAETAMDKALAALAKIANPAEVYEWDSDAEALIDITKDWTDASWKAGNFDYKAPVIFTGAGDLTYRVREAVTFGGGLAVPNATSLDLSHVLDLGPVSKPITIKGAFRGGVAADEWRFYLKADGLTLDNVTYRGQVFNAVTDDRALNLVGTNDFSGAVMSVAIDSLLKDPNELFVTRLVAVEGDAMLWLRRFDFSNRNVLEEVIGQKTASFTVGENVTLVTTENVLFGIKGATLTVDGALDAAGVDIAGHLLGLLPQEATVTGAGKLTTTHFGMCDKSTLNLGVRDTTLRSSVPYRTYTDSANGCNVKWIQRAPDYADASGKDWLFNHDIKAKRYEGEPAEDPGVDLFYFYPTSVNVSDDHCVDGICDIDDPYLRGPAGATLSWKVTGAMYGDFTHVYAPYYRQTPVDVETMIGEQPDANATMRQYWYQRAPYEDVTNALTHYFTVINPNGERPFILAGHSHGSGMLSLVMEHFFAEEGRKAWLKNMVACYAIGWGVSKDWEAKLNDALDMYVATNATDAGVYVFWNTYGGPDASAYEETLLYPKNAAPSVNPLLWTRAATNATAELNLGGWVTNRFDQVLPHLYDASNNVERGTIVCTAPQLMSQYIPEDPGYGRYSLHSWDCRAYWENLRANAYQRIETATGRKPCCGTPTDYGQVENWLSRPATVDKDLDVFYLYPTCVPGSCTTLVGEIDDGMKANAQEEYKKGPSTFESYANVYVPYYRQGSVLMIMADPTAAGTQRFCSTHVVKTDVFAALDYYFTNINVSAARPFILASHSQGSANMVNVLEEYFVGKRAAYTNQLVAAYVLGWKITPDWCEKVGIPFATGAADTGVVLTWNAEGPGATSDNFLTDDPTQLAINPINWKTDAAEAYRAENLGSVVTNAEGVLYNTGAPGITGARLQAGRAGAVIVDDPATIPVGISPGFGTKSYHFEDWGFFLDNIGVNGLNRFASFTDQVFVDPYDFRVNHATFAVKTNDVQALSGPVGAAVVEKGATAVAVYTAEEGYLFDAKEQTATVSLDTSVSLARLAAGAELPVARPVCVRFERSSFEVQEGGAVTVRILRGETDEASQATVSYVKETGAYSAAYMDGKAVSFPLVLSWAKGERQPKEILFRTTTSSRAEADKRFTLQLSASVGECVDKRFDACTVTIKDAQGGAEAKPYVRALAWPANAGTASGAGTLATEKAYRTLSASAKSYATFAGWYKARADDPNAIDLAAPVEPYSVRYPRQIRVGYGTDNAAGTYFAYFTNVLAVATVVEPKAFDDLTGDPLPGVAGVVSQDAASGLYETMVGVKFALPVDYLEDSGKGKLTVTKLPNGLNYNAKKDRIEGVPTKAGFFETTFVASNAAGKHTVTYAFVVDEMPALAVGTFAGTVSDDAAEGPHRTGVGAVSFTAGKTGALSAKVTRRLSGTRSFSVKGYDYLDADTLGVAMTNGYGEVFEATLVLTGGWYDTTLRGSAFGGTKRGTLGDNDEEDGVFVAVRNAFTTSDGNAEAQQVLAAFKGTYAETLYATNGVGEAEEEVGTVQYRVNAQGSVYVAAKHAATYDGEKKVAGRTLSGTVAGAFVYDETTGLGGCGAALRSGTYLWSTEALLDYATRDVRGAARYIRPNAEDKTEVVDEDQLVGEY